MLQNIKPRPKHSKSKDGSLTTEEKVLVNGLLAQGYQAQDVAYIINQGPLSHFLKENDKALSVTLKAIETIKQDLADNLHNNSCLCHGTAGNADILQELATRMRRPDLAEFARSNLKKHIDTYHATLTWPTDAPDNGYHLGLMIGIAGIGYAYLRQHSPSLPSLLDIG